MPPAIDLDPRSLIGSWELSRVIDDRLAAERSTLEGRTDFTLQTDGRIKWSESGILHRGSTSVEVSRVLFFEPRESGWFVTFEDGRDFHPWEPGIEVVHPCMPDTYVGTVLPLGDDRWSVEWRATGPSKDYAMMSVLTAQPTSPIAN